jgi:hypothetical protein
MDDHDAAGAVSLTAEETRASRSVGVEPDPKGPEPDPLLLSVWSDPDLPTAKTTPQDR